MPHWYLLHAGIHHCPVLPPSSCFRLADDSDDLLGRISIPLRTPSALLKSSVYTAISDADISALLGMDVVHEESLTSYTVSNHLITCALHTYLMSSLCSSASAEFLCCFLIELIYMVRWILRCPYIFLVPNLPEYIHNFSPDCISIVHPTETLATRRSNARNLPKFFCKS